MCGLATRRLARLDVTCLKAPRRNAGAGETSSEQVKWSVGWREADGWSESRRQIEWRADWRDVACSCARRLAMNVSGLGDTPAGPNECERLRLVAHWSKPGVKETSCAI